MFNNDSLEFVDISEDEGEDIFDNSGRMPLRPINTSRDSASLPTPPLSGRSTSSPINYSNPSISPPSENMSIDFGSPYLHFPFPPIALDQLNGSRSSVSPLPSIIPELQESENQERPEIDHFLSRINAGREIQCLLCEKGFEEDLLLKHICDDHFVGYQPLKCRQCDFRTGDRYVMITTHLLESGHEIGALNCEIIGERNENVEFVIRLLFSHALFAHGGSSKQNKESVLYRLKTASRMLRDLRLQAPGGGAAKSDHFEDHQAVEANPDSVEMSESMPLLIRSTDIVRPISTATPDPSPTDWSEENHEGGSGRSSKSPLVNNQISTMSSPPVLSPQIDRDVPSSSGISLTPSRLVQINMPLVCEFCRIGFPNLASLKPHFQSCHAEGYIPFKCSQSDCNYGQWRERLVRTHIIERHEIKTGKIPAAKPTPEQKIQLEILIQSLQAKGIPVDEMKNYLTAGQ